MTHWGDHINQGFNLPYYDMVNYLYTGNQLTTASYLLNGNVVAMLNFTYDGNGNIIGISSIPTVTPPPSQVTTPSGAFGDVGFGDSGFGG